MPISGIFNENPDRVKYNMCSLATLVFVVFLILGYGELYLEYKFSLSRVFSLGSVGGFIFIAAALIGACMLHNMGRKWPHIIITWSSKELIFCYPPYKMLKTSLTRRLRTTAFMIYGCALTEHSFYLFSGLSESHQQLMGCNNTEKGVIELFFENNRAHLFGPLTFHPLLIPVLEWTNVTMTFCWNTIDIFIVVVSIGLAYRYEQLNVRINSARYKNMPESFWNEIREHYVLLGDLLKFVDIHVENFIILSCSNNLYFICVQLYNSFQYRPLLITNTYFWFSLLFVIGRTLCVLFFGAFVFDASRYPMRVLRQIPAESWSLDAQRFFQQVISETNALSGKNFFYITRKLILGMTATIVTYELVLLDQVDNLNSKEIIDRCAF